MVVNDILSIFLTISLQLGLAYSSMPLFRPLFLNKDSSEQENYCLL